MSETTVNSAYAVDVSHFSRFTPGREAPIWWGVIGLILIEMSVVTGFVMSALYLQMRNSPWPPGGTEVPSVFLPTLSLILMLTSCGTMYLASKAINRNSVRAFVIYTYASVALAGLTLLVRWKQFDNFPVRWDEHVYGSLLWTISGFHFVHVVSAAIGTAVIGLLGILGYFNRDRRIGVVVDTLYWNFVAIAWIPFYLVLYWAPRIG